jgi:hypothetical protein
MGYLEKMIHVENMRKSSLFNIFTISLGIWIDSMRLKFRDRR